MRNYKRHLGVLLSTHWDIRELELGVFEKEYDQAEAKYYYERKIIKLNPQSCIDLQWIQERKAEEQMIQEDIADTTQAEKVEKIEISEIHEAENIEEGDEHGENKEDTQEQD